MLSLKEKIEIAAVVPTLAGMTFKFFKTMYNVGVQSKKMYENVEYISEHFANNGGSTLFDKIDRIERKIGTVHHFQQAYLNLEEKTYFRSDCEGNFLWVSERWVAFTGLSPKYSYGDNWLNGIAVAERNCVQKKWMECIKTISPFQVDCKTTLGIHVILIANPVFDNGVCHGWVGRINSFKEDKNETVFTNNV